MKLLSIVLLASLCAMPVASLAGPNDTPAEAKGCPFAVQKQPNQNALDAKNEVAPVIKGHSSDASKATGVDPTAQGVSG